MIAGHQIVDEVGVLDLLTSSNQSVYVQRCLSRCLSISWGRDCWHDLLCISTESVLFISAESVVCEKYTVAFLASSFHPPLGE